MSGASVTSEAGRSATALPSHLSRRLDEEVTFPISRQGLEQIALVLAVGVVLFGGFALVRRLQHGEWRRLAMSAGVIGALILRGSLIRAGVALVHRFRWIIAVFGGSTEFQVADTPEELSALKTDFEKDFLARGIQTRRVAYRKI